MRAGAMARDIFAAVQRSHFKCGHFQATAMNLSPEQH